MATDSLPPFIRAQLTHLLTHSPFSIKCGTCHTFMNLSVYHTHRVLSLVDRIWSGCNNSAYSDRFTLLIPFCLDYIRWDVIYNAQYPLAAPDIIFSPDDEDFHPFQMASQGEGEIPTTKSCLADWNYKDPTRLLSLIHELRDLYMSYQRKRVGEVDDARLKFEINTVLSREEQGIEVCLISGSEKPEEVKFAVPLLNMDLNKLVHGCPWRHQQKIYLQVIFPVTKKYSSAPAPRIKLVASSELKTFFAIEDVKLPPWLDGMCMAEYLPNFEDYLGQQILDAVVSVNARRRFIEALAPLFGRPVEADPVFCRRATVLAVSGVFTFLVHFSIPTQFPKQQPTLMMQSSQHFNSQGAPVMSRPIIDYPWSPRWDTVLMVERIHEFLVEECLNFKKYCNETLLAPQ